MPLRGSPGWLPSLAWNALGEVARSSSETILNSLDVRVLDSYVLAQNTLLPQSYQEGCNVYFWRQQQRNHVVLARSNCAPVLHFGFDYLQHGEDKQPPRPQGVSHPLYHDAPPQVFSRAPRGSQLFVNSFLSQFMMDRIVKMMGIGSQTLQADKK